MLPATFFFRQRHHFADAPQDAKRVPASRVGCSDEASLRPDGQLYAYALPPDALPRIAINFILHPCLLPPPSGNLKCFRSHVVSSVSV